MDSWLYFFGSDRFKDFEYYNITALIIQPLFILFIYYQLFDSGTMKKVILAAMLIYPVLYTLNLSWGKALKNLVATPMLLFQFLSASSPTFS
jgi:hypothetical protein